jgi:hypothetical protein
MTFQHDDASSNCFGISPPDCLLNVILPQMVYAAKKQAEVTPMREQSCFLLRKEANMIL